MKITKPQINGFVLTVLMPSLLLIGPGALGFLIFALVVFFSNSLRNYAIIVFIIFGTWFFSRISPVFYDLSPQMQLNALNTTFGYFLLLLSPFLRVQYRISSSFYTDFGIVFFLVFGFLVTYLGFIKPAIMQVGSFSVLLYAFFSDTWFRRLLGASSVVIAGSRIMMIGLLLAVLVFKWRRLSVFITSVLLVIVIGLALMPSTFLMLEDILSNLYADGIFLKGRVMFWLAILSDEYAIFGHGIGWSVDVVESFVGYSQLPHNEYLRVFGDYGVFGLILLFVVLYFNVVRGQRTQKFATAILAFYLLTGNPLSFPTVIVSYVLICHAKVVKKNSQFRPVSDVESV